MNYSLFILPRAQKELAQLTSAAYPRVRDAIRELAENPRPPGCLKGAMVGAFVSGIFGLSTRSTTSSAMSLCSTSAIAEMSIGKAAIPAGSMNKCQATGPYSGIS